MAQPSKFGTAFLFVFGLAFGGFGLFAVWAFLASSPVVHKNGNPALGAVFASVFALIGIGLMIGSLYGYRQLKQEAATKEANPDSPWLWRADWASGQALSRSRNTVFGWWIGTILSSMIVVPVLVSGLPQLVRNSDPKALILIGLALLPLILLIGALRATIRRERYGTTYFEFASLPFAPGKHVSGQIHLRLNASAQHGIDLRIACIRRIVTGSGKEQSTNEVVLWQDEKNVPQTALSVGPLGTSMPVDFGIPQDAYETNHDEYRDQLSWVLFAKADVPGVDYSDSFEIPVFRTANAAQSESASANYPSNFAQSGFASLSGFGSSSGFAATGTAPAFESDATEVPAPANPKVIVTTASDGSTEFYFPAFRNPKQTIFLLLFTAVWSGGVYALFHSRAPWFFAPAFGFFDLLLIYGCMQAMFGSVKIVVGNGKISSERKILGSARRREVPFTEVQSVLATMPVQNSNAVNGPYSLKLQTKNGQNFVLADNIASRDEARWIISQIEKLAGLKTDTHVALEGAFGREYGPPPQRGVSSAPLPGAKRQRTLAIVISIAIFVAWTAFIFSTFIGFRSRASRARTIGSPNSSVQQTSAHRVFATLTDQDIAQLQQLPTQQQAEELLERAIKHDQRALELFEQNIMSPEWLGRIKLTDQMKALERRSQFSSDLRVRYANADLNLSMDGWTKTEQSADLLITRARTDAQYRAAAVYFMGMLAGRGIAYGRLHPVLVDYAKHAPDATVRVWAVEGMRYLGTDEALDELFDSFVNDTSNLVRDRAGCNISDCGNFKRAQRMRMVPKFIALAADANTTPLLRNWSFMALHEITDESLPNDAATWQRWYNLHGNDKLLQFEKAPWWQVRGDE